MTAPGRTFSRASVSRGPARLALPISSHLLCRQTIQTGGIAYDHLSNLRLRNSSEVFGNLLPRVREGALGMGIVGTPHQTLDTDQFPCQYSRAIVFEGRPELPLKVITRRFIHLGLHPMTMIGPPVIHRPQH